MLNFVGEITDPIHKYIRITKVERELIDSHVFQRLRKIRQLAGAHLVYPGANHTRFEHSLGTMHLTGLAAQSLLDKGYIIKKDQIEILRLAALLHDIGHGPFSHLFEEVLLVKKTHTTSHENIGKKIIRETIIHDILAKYGYDSSYIATISFGESPVIFYNELISGALSSDIMDYLPRDSFFTGVEYGKIDYYRLISSLEVLSNGHLGINKSAINSLESMLISRYQMFKAVYFHKTVRSAEVMLLHSLLEADSQMHFSSLSLDDFIGYTDESIIDAICSLKSGSAVKLARDYKHRQLLKCVYEKFLQNKNKTDNIDLVTKQNILKNIIKSLDIQDDLIFIDVSRTPSMPLTPTKQELNSIMLVDKDSEFETPISEIPLIDSISGFLDMIRVYTTDVNRDKLEKALKNIDLLPDD
ncbi:MAG: HD domain-containing protein [Nitrososphaeraceae archaeon]|nr:HD domain-containing protein [Nitrososphaeraceae archaeon]